MHRFESPLEDALRAARGTTTEPYTGHAEAWFERGGANAARGRRRPAGGRSRTSGRFIDLPRSAIWVGKEHVFVDRI